MREPNSLYDLSYTTNSGEEVPFARYKGTPVLIVNTARNCGLAGQYAELQTLHEKYSAQGLTVIGFPCDQFAHQEPGSDEVIATECRVNFGVTFPLSTKVEVNGAGAHPVFQYLKAKAPGTMGSKIKWNFTKFLVAPDGVTVHRFAPTTKPESIEGLIKSMLPAESSAGAQG